MSRNWRFYVILSKNGLIDTLWSSFQLHLTKLKSQGAL